MFTLTGLVVLIGLGTWQIQRLHWKEGLIAERTAALGAPPVDPPETPDQARALNFHPIRAEGKFLNDDEFLIHGIDRESGNGGYFVVTPLLLTNARLLFVNRGWVPENRKSAASRAEGNIDGMVMVEGLLRLPPEGGPGWFTPENRLDAGEWFSIDLALMTQALNRPGKTLPYYLDAGPAPNPGGYPIGGQTNTDLPNDHLQYAITWYSLALALLVIYAIYARRHLGPTSG